MRTIVIAVVIVTLGACASESDRRSTVDQSICTIEDAEAGLCDPTESLRHRTRAHAQAELDALYPTQPIAQDEPHCHAVGTHITHWCSTTLDFGSWRIHIFCEQYANGRQYCSGEVCDSSGQCLPPD